MTPYNAITSMTFQRAVLCTAFFLGALPLAGCDPNTVLDVADPDVVRPGSLTGKEALPALRSGVFGSFQIAFSGGGDLQNGGHEGIINLGGLFSDELINAETFSDRINLDAHRVTAANGTMVALFLDLSRARAAAAAASRKYAAVRSRGGRARGDDRDRRVRARPVRGALLLGRPVQHDHRQRGIAVRSTR